MPKMYFLVIKSKHRIVSTWLSYVYEISVTQQQRTANKLQLYSIFCQQVRR